MRRFEVILTCLTGRTGNFPGRLSRNRRRHFSRWLDIHAGVERHVHPMCKGMNQNSMMARISRWGEG
jgi:hypothetical protein